MALLDTAPASQVEEAPPGFWMLLPVIVTFAGLVHTTASQPDGTGVGVLVAVLSGAGELVLVRVGVLVNVGVVVRVRVLVGVVVRVPVGRAVGVPDEPPGRG